ncbi:hypothetical protein M2175_004338 [Bradyrhizobium elkanii]|uniref:hypothetical protein n=1 Tax=Bradyrhizobium TaxID=374 RepID=UPI0004AF2655|nr:MULTISPECIES: hypothetical protein [Bradyrhizobium]MCS3929307.1 hypothetical protein [Bradyrhizobium elkanii]MCS3969863.1 hypothetical protein [Bradyrhizobium japonicum]
MIFPAILPERLTLSGMKPEKSMPQIRLRGKTYDLDAPLRGAKAIGELRGTSEREAFYAAEANKFTYRKDGRTIVSTAREILTPLLGEAGVERLVVREIA